MKQVPELDVEIRAECRVHASEDPQKVIRAVKNVISNCAPEHIDSRVTVISRSPEALTKIYEQVRSRRVTAVLRKFLLSNAIGNATWFYLNKQAAYAGVVSICAEETESPMGPIKVTIRSNRLEDVMGWLVPL